MKVITALLEDITKIKKDVYLLSFSSSYLAKRSLPGQFLHIRVDSFLALRRPFSIHKVEQDKIFVLFKVRGKGTLLFSRYKRGTTLDIIGPLGKGFTYQLPVANRSSATLKATPLHILLGGGMGVAPLMFLAQRVIESREGRVERGELILLGAKSKNEILCKDDFKKLGFRVSIATEDGSLGFKGTVIDLLKNTLSTLNSQLSTKIYACGPKEMFYDLARVLKNYSQIECQASFEQFMGCGLGICLGCAIKTRYGYKRVCKDGPVFNIRDIFKI